MRNKGFTLVELMVIIAIIGVTTAIAIPQLALWETRTNGNRAIMSDKDINTLESIKVVKYIQGKAEEAKKYIDVGIPLSAVKDEQVHHIMVKIMADKTQEIVMSPPSTIVDGKGRKIVADSNGNETFYQDEHTMDFEKTPEPPRPIICEESTGIMKKCTLTMNQLGIIYRLNLLCESVNGATDEYICEVM